MNLAIQPALIWLVVECLFGFKHEGTSSEMVKESVPLSWSFAQNQRKKDVTLDRRGFDVRILYVVACFLEKKVAL